MTEVIQKTLRDSAALRWTALLLLALAMFCAYIFMDILSPIKDLSLPASFSTRWVCDSLQCSRAL